MPRYMLYKHMSYIVTSMVIKQQSLLNQFLKLTKSLIFFKQNVDDINSKKLTNIRQNASIVGQSFHVFKD